MQLPGSPSLEGDIIGLHATVSFQLGMNFLFLSEEFPAVQKIVLLHKLTALMAVIRDRKQKQQSGRKKNKNSIKKLRQPTALRSHSVCLCVHVCVWWEFMTSVC